MDYRYKIEVEEFDYYSGVERHLNKRKEQGWELHTITNIGVKGKGEAASFVMYWKIWDVETDKDKNDTITVD